MLNELLLSLAPAVDVFFGAFSCGVSKIKITKTSTAIMAIISTVALCLPIFLSSYITKFVPEKVCLIVGVVVLLFVGLTNIFKSYIKELVRRTSEKCLNISKFGFVIEVYIEETKADKDFSKVLSWKEAVVLGIAVAIDGLVVGFGAGLSTDINLPFITVSSLIIDACAVIFGALLGHKIANRKKDFSWLGGIILIALAFFRLCG
jgi:putative sporulation protein YtaF